MEEEKEEKLAINREDAEEKGRRRRRRSASFSLSFLQTLVFLLRRVYSLLPRPPSFLSFANSVLQLSLLFSLACSLTLLIYSAQEGKKKKGEVEAYSNRKQSKDIRSSGKREREDFIFNKISRSRSIEELGCFFFFFPFSLQ